jgi:hypothetical protein
MSWRDVLAMTAGRTPSNGWMLPSQVDGRFGVRYEHHRLMLAREYLVTQELQHLVPLIDVDPMVTAQRLAEWSEDQ